MRTKYISAQKTTRKDSKVGVATKSTARASEAARQSYGGGTVEPLKSGRWRVRVRLPDGSRIGDTCGTLEEAEKLRLALVADRDARTKAGEYAEAIDSAKPVPDTLATWGATWLERREPGVRWFGSDRSRWRLYVASSDLARLPLPEVRVKHVREWLGVLQATKRDGKLLSTGTMRHVFNLVHKALADAVQDELINANPALGVKVPKRHAVRDGDEWTFLSAAEIAAIEGCDAIPEPERLIYRVAIFTGLRAGELWALRWGDVREADSRPDVVVRRSHDNATKNGKVQAVPLLPEARAAFARLRALATDDGKGPEPEDLVLPTTRGYQRQPSSDAGWSSRKVRGIPRVGLKEAAGITRRVRFHDLRHTFASHLVMGTWTAAPLSLMEVRSMIRHGSITMTERYAHLGPDHLHARIAGPVPTVSAVDQVVHVDQSNLVHAGRTDSAKTTGFQAVPPVGVEPTTFGLGSRCSIH